MTNKKPERSIEEIIADLARARGGIVSICLESAKACQVATKTHSDMCKRLAKIQGQLASERSRFTDARDALLARFEAESESARILALTQEIIGDLDRTETLVIATLRTLSGGVERPSKLSH